MVKLAEMVASWGVLAPLPSQAFSTEVEQLGDSEASDLLISGSLIRVKGWWRKGARDWDWYRNK